MCQMNMLHDNSIVSLDDTTIGHISFVTLLYTTLGLLHVSKTYIINRTAKATFLHHV